MSLYNTEFNTPKKSIILASGLNVSKEELAIHSPKKKLLFWKPDKFKNLKEAAWKQVDKIPEADLEEEDETEFICDEGVKA